MKEPTKKLKEIKQEGKKKETKKEEKAENRN